MAYTPPQQPFREKIAYEQFVLSPEDFGCKGEYESRSQGIWNSGDNTFSDTYFKFEKKHIGWSFYQDGATKRTIVDVNETTNKITISPNGYGTTDINWRIVGQNDTPYMQAFLDALSPDYGKTTTYDEPVYGINGLVTMGKIGLLTPGKAYPVGLDAAQYAAGERVALKVRRRTSITTAFAPQSSHGAAIVGIPQHYGHIIGNKNATSYTDFTTLSNFTIRPDGEFTNNGGNGLEWEIPYDNFAQVDPFNRFVFLRVEKGHLHGYRFKGRGEINIRDCDAFGCGGYGMFIDRQYDCSVIGGRFGGNRKTGFYCDSPGPLQVADIKSYYSGSNGGSNDEDCANIVIANSTGDYHSGGAFMSNCQSQESRGCGIIIKVRSCVTSNLQIQDPNRAPIGSGTRPTIKAGIYLKGPVACGNYIDAIVMPALTEYATPNWPADTHVLYIGGDNPFSTTNGGPQNNRGDITYPVDYIKPGNTVLKGIEFTGSGAAIAGGGTINGKNTGLRVNGVALT